jgi:ElaB/YqjD/DUF883 family membrane-anchored ribosome-binding protein
MAFNYRGSFAGRVRDGGFEGRVRPHSDSNPLSDQERAHRATTNATKEMTMMNQVDELNRAKNRMAGDIKTVIADGEDLLKAAAGVSGEGFVAAREKFAEKLGNARERLAGAVQPAVDRARKTAAAADGYVHDNPWTLIGIAATAGILIGFLAARR